MYNQALASGVLSAIKKSPKGIFPAQAQKAGISQRSKLGQAIKNSRAGVMPAALRSAMSAAGKGIAGSMGKKK